MDSSFQGSDLLDPPSEPLSLLLGRLGLTPGALSGRTALITGGARGIGRQAALGLAFLGARVCVVDKRARGAEVVAAIDEAGGEALFVHDNICLDGAMASAVARCVERLGPVDLLLNNAVEFSVRSVTELSLEDWDYTFGTNLRAPLVACRAVVEGMLARGRGVIANMVAPSGIAYAADMSASKAALRSLTVSLADEVGRSSGVSVFGFLPGLVATDLVRENFPLYTERLGLDFATYVEQTRPNPGYEGLQPVQHCGAALVHALVHAERHHGLIADPFEPLVAAGVVEESAACGEPGPAALDNVDRLRSEMRAVRSLNLQLEREVGRRTRELARLASIVESSTDAIITCDLEGRIASFNPAAVRLLGWSEEEAVGAHISAFAPPDELDRQQAIFAEQRSGPRPPLDTVRLHRDGTRIPVNMVFFHIRDEAGDIVSLAAILRDRRPLLEAERVLEEARDLLRQRSKLAAMGELAGGVAHDFNNMLMVILPSLTSVMESLGSEDERGQELRDALGAARRSRALTRQLLTFSRKEPRNPTVLDVDTVVRDTQRLLRRGLGDDVQVELELGGPGLLVHIDRGQLEQVLLNLAVNARDAMPGGGSLTIGTAEALSDEGEFVEIRVSDEGRGMDRETLSRIFEPFFTTKASGQGSGMGLATVYGVVTGSGGQVTASSRPGEGSSFRVLLPRHDGPAEPSAPSVDLQAERRPFGVLLVEDEPLVRRVTRRMLERLGYTVYDAESAERALEVLAEHHEAIRVLLTDVVMPGWSGPELVREVARRHPEIQSLYISGYADDPGLLRAGPREALHGEGAHGPPRPGRHGLEA